MALNTRRMGACNPSRRHIRTVCDALTLQIVDITDLEPTSLR